MKNISHEINELLENKSYEELSAVEQEMVLSQMSEALYTERYEVLHRVQDLLEQESISFVPDVNILNDLKTNFSEQQEMEERTRFIPWSGKVSIYKSAAAVLLAILGSYFVFGRTAPKLEYLVQEKIVEKKIYDTVYRDRIVEVPVEKIVKVVTYKTIPAKPPVQHDKVNFVIKQSESSYSEKMIKLEEPSKSYGNSKINEEELEQFRVSL